MHSRVTCWYHLSFGPIFLIAAGLLVITDCGGGGETTPPGTTIPVSEITTGAAGSKGIFDPALAYEPPTGRIWMSYSTVDDSAMWPGQNFMISTRLAYSEDAGANWLDSGTLINAAVDVTLPAAPPNNAGTWNHEVSSLVYDPGAPAGERWKMIWHRYLWMNGNRLFQHGWIGMRTAPAPDGPWSAERKLFVGSLYDPVNNTTIGVPEVQLHLLDTELNNCLTYSEPGMLATADTLYVVLLGVDTAVGNRIILLKWAHGVDTWEYVDTFLVGDVDAAHFGYDGFTAPDIYEDSGAYYLITTPQTAEKYLGTFVFEIQDLDAATLVRTGGFPDIVLEHHGATDTHNGASGYVSQATASGLIYCEVLATVTPLDFEIYASHTLP